MTTNLGWIVNLACKEHVCRPKRGLLVCLSLSGRVYLVWYRKRRKHFSFFRGNRTLFFLAAIIYQAPFERSVCFFPTDKFVHALTTIIISPPPLPLLFLLDKSSRFRLATWWQAKLRKCLCWCENTRVSVSRDGIKKNLSIHKSIGEILRNWFFFFCPIFPENSDPENFTSSAKCLCHKNWFQSHTLFLSYLQYF